MGGQISSSSSDKRVMRLSILFELSAQSDPADTTSNTSKVTLRKSLVITAELLRNSEGLQNILLFRSIYKGMQDQA